MRYLSVFFLQQCLISYNMAVFNSHNWSESSIIYKSSGMQIWLFVIFIFEGNQKFKKVWKTKYKRAAPYVRAKIKKITQQFTKMVSNCIWILWRRVKKMWPFFAVNKSKKTLSIIFDSLRCWLSDFVDLKRTRNLGFRMFRV